MIWTIIILVVAIALFMLWPLVLKHESKGNMPAWKVWCIKCTKLVSIILLIIGVNRLGLGTSYYMTESNPMIIQKMANNATAQLRADKEREMTKNVKDFVPKNMDMLTADAPILGNVNAKKTIFLFSDYTCGYCHRVHGELMRVLQERDDVRVVVKNFAIHGVMSDFAARAAIAAKMQSNDKAAALDKLLMSEDFVPSDRNKMGEREMGAAIKKNILKLAAKAGLDTKKLEQDADSATVMREMGQVRELASRFNINGTPFLIIQDKAFSGAIPYEDIIEALK